MACQHAVLDSARHPIRRGAREPAAHDLRPPGFNSDDRRGVVGGADDRRAPRPVVSTAVPGEEPHRHGSAMAGKDDGRDRGRGHGRAPVRDDARRARRAGAGGRLHEPRQPRARSRDDTAARDRGAPRARRVEVAAGAGAVPRERDSRGGRGDRVLRRVRAAARRDRHRNQPRDAVRRTDDAVVSSGAERDGVGRRRVVTPRGAGRLRPRAGDPADAHDRRARRARRRIDPRAAAPPAPARPAAVAGRDRGRVLHHRDDVREVLDRGSAARLRRRSGSDRGRGPQSRRA